MSKAEEIEIQPELEKPPEVSGIQKFLNLYVEARAAPFTYLEKNPKFANLILSTVCFVLYNAYFIYALIHRHQNNLEWEFCDGHGFLVIVTSIIYFGVFYYQILVPYLGPVLESTLHKPISKFKSGCYFVCRCSLIQYFWNLFGTYVPV